MIRDIWCNLKTISENDPLGCHSFETLGVKAFGQMMAFSNHYLQPYHSTNMTLQVLLGYLVRSQI